MDRTSKTKGIVSFDKIKTVSDTKFKNNSKRAVAPSKLSKDTTTTVKGLNLNKNSSSSSSSKVGGSSDSSSSAMKSAENKKSDQKLTKRVLRKSVEMPKQGTFLEKMSEQLSENPVSSFGNAPRNINKVGQGKKDSVSPLKSAKQKSTILSDVSDDKQLKLRTRIPNSPRSSQPVAVSPDKKLVKTNNMDGERSSGSSPVKGEIPNDKIKNTKEQGRRINNTFEGNEGMDNDADNLPRSGRQRSGQVLDTASSASSSPRRNLDSTSSSSERTPKAEEGNEDVVNTIYKSKSDSYSDSGKNPEGIVSFSELKRTLTKKLSSVKLSQTVSVNKKASSPKSIKKSDAQKAISALPVNLRFNFARELYDFKNTEEYKNFSEKTKFTNIFLKASLFLREMGLEFNNDELQKALLKDAGNYKNQIIDLGDPVYVDHVKKSLEEEIKGAWNNLNVGEKTPYEKLVEEDKICRVFSRDFDHSHYYVKQSNGKTKKIDSMDEYVSFASNGVITDMPRIISVLAAQSFGIFLRNALYNRKSTSHTRFEFGSALTLPNGIPVSPQNTRGVGNDISYTMEKKYDGSFVVEYTRALYAKPGNPILVRTIDFSAKTYALRDDCFIRIYAPITIQPDGEWEIGNVELQTFNIEEAPTQQ